MPMISQALLETEPPRRTGRPPKQDGAVPTRDRLIAAAIEVFGQEGFSGASVTQIATRAGISGPAVYKHFAGKADLLIQAARHSLDSVSGAARRSDPTPAATAKRWLSPDFAETRRLILELHLAAGREDELMDLLAEWHLEQAGAWQERRTDSVEQIKVFYLLLLGLSQTDILCSLDADPSLVVAHVERMVAALFPSAPETR
ncbi:MAG: TetR/AcrR family transcriptional regulator [Acidimicrobiales bacterium]